MSLKIEREKGRAEKNSHLRLYISAKCPESESGFVFDDAMQS